MWSISVNHKIYEDEALLELFDAGATYATLMEDTPLVAAAVNPVDSATLAATQRGFGYTREDVKMILQPMAAEGKDAVWSMGDDTPLAFLARSPRPVYAYFRQRFAQVTNPPIDSSARVLRGLAAYAAWPVASHAGQECSVAGCFADLAVSLTGAG